MTDWTELAAAARHTVDAVRDDPEGRLQLRREFYRRVGRGAELVATGRLSAADPDSAFGYGRSELDFLRWEIRRGVLNPEDGSRGRPGSPWWRRVNLSFLYDGQLALLGHDAGLTAAGAEVPAACWLEYIGSPGDRAWYRAHNASIVAAYERHRRTATREARPEQVFVNAVLYRLLFAQGMVEGVEFGRLGEFLANPRLPSVDALVHLPDFYPDHYPLSRADIRHVMHRGHDLEVAATLCLDEVLIHPQLARLYRAAATWNQAPFLEQWIRHGEPVYPTLDPAQPLLSPLIRLLRLPKRSR
jgi:hypothetical protein